MTDLLSTNDSLDFLSLFLDIFLEVSITTHEYKHNIELSKPLYNSHIYYTFKCRFAGDFLRFAALLSGVGKTSIFSLSVDSREGDW